MACDRSVTDLSPGLTSSTASAVARLSQYRIAAVTRMGANQLTFPNQESGRDEIVSEYFGQKYYPLRVSHFRVFVCCFRSEPSACVIIAFTYRHVCERPRLGGCSFPFTRGGKEVNLSGVRAASGILPLRWEVSI